jgi:hypothetical protein
MNKYYLLSLSDEESNSETNFNDSRYFNLNFLRADSDLFDDNSDVSQAVIRVRRVKLPKSGEDWEILEDDKIVLTIKGARFTASERGFLRTVDGIKFLMEGYKVGIKSVAKFKAALKKLKI